MLLVESKELSCSIPPGFGSGCQFTAEFAYFTNRLHIPWALSISLFLSITVVQEGRTQMQYFSKVTMVYFQRQGARQKQKARLSRISKYLSFNKNKTRL